MTANVNNPQRTPPARPRAPSQAAWDAMTAEERARVVRSLPAWVEEAAPNEGDRHYDARNALRQTLRGFFQRTKPRVYVGAELAVYYPDEERFVPDVIAVTDVDVRDRDSWIVSAEGKGLDWVLEVSVKGDRWKDLEGNVIRYAALGIQEYFIFDRRHKKLIGYRVPSPGVRSFVPIVPQGGAIRSEVLGLELYLDGAKLRLRAAGEMLLELDEVIVRLEEHIEEAAIRAEDAEARAAHEASQRAEAEQRAHDAEQRAHEAERRAAEVQQRAAEAEQRAAEVQQRAAEAEQRAAEAEQRAAEAQQRAAEAEQRMALEAEQRAALDARLRELTELLARTRAGE